MQRTKKIISALLAIVMLMSVLTVGVSAATAVSGSYKTLAYYEVTDADGNVVTTVTPGQEVTVNVYFNSASASDDLASSQVQIWFDDEVYSYVDGSLAWGTTIQGWYDASQSEIVKYDESSTVKLYTNSITAATDDGTLTTHPTWLSCMVLYLVDGGSETYYIQENADEAIASFKLKVADDVTAEDDFNIGCPSSLVWSKAVSSRGAAYHYVKSAKTSTIGTGEVQPVPEVELTLGSTADPEVALQFSDVKNQIRFDKTADGKYANTFDGRMVVSIDNLADVVGADVNLASVQAKIKEIGFLYAKNGAINADTALAQIKGGAATYSVATGGGYISTGFAEADYAVTGIIHNIPDADKATAVSAAVYAIYDSNGDGVDEYTVFVLNGGETFTFEDLYSRNFNTAFPA